MIISFIKTLTSFLMLPFIIMVNRLSGSTARFHSVHSLNFLFYHPFVKERAQDISYGALHVGAGFSGTENAVIELSKYLVDIGHKVTVLGITRASIKSAGVVFKPYTGRLKKGLDWKPLLKDLDIFTPIFYFEDIIATQIIKYLSVRKACGIWLWFQSFPGNNDYNTGLTALRSAGRNVLCSFVSDYSRQAYLPMYKELCTHFTTIGNGIPGYYLNQSENTANRRKGNWVFHALFERGGRVAENVFMKVRNSSPISAQALRFASYVPSTAGENASAALSDLSSSPSHFPSTAVTYHGTLSKRNISELLGRSDYFPYLLADTNTNFVHHDTYATVVLEALARGVIVVTWDVACFKNVFGDNVIRLQVQQPSDGTVYDPSARTGRNSWMTSTDAVEVVAQAILRLEDGQQAEKERLRISGQRWAEQFTWERIGQRYASWFSDVFLQNHSKLNPT